MTSPQSYVWFITGASRGIGLELTKQLLESPSNIILAACRDPSKATALKTLAQSSNGRVHVLTADVTNHQSIRDAAKEAASIVGDSGIDYLVNNAGIIAADSAFTADPAVMQKLFDTNVVGPAYVTQVFLPLVEKSGKKTVVNVSSELGRLTADYGALATSYSITKAALNMLTYKQQKERPDIVFISLCPGWLKTDLGGQGAPNDVDVGVAGVIKTITGLTPQDSGKFFNYKGENVAW
ncbi:NAD-P-binding protein [Cubamyces sp. BRFM 1775]|nr:NAD-P-binding protein [Cubamyces sp. BRFM 1775]